METLREDHQTILQRGVEAIGATAVVVFAVGIVETWELYSGIRSRLDRGYRERVAEDLVGEAYLSGINHSRDLSVLLMPKATRLSVQRDIEAALDEFGMRDI